MAIVNYICIIVVPPRDGWVGWKWECHPRAGLGQECVTSVQCHTEVGNTTLVSWNVRKRKYYLEQYVFYENKEFSPDCVFVFSDMLT